VLIAFSVVYHTLQVSSFRFVNLYSCTLAVTRLYQYYSRGLRRNRTNFPSPAHFFSFPCCVSCFVCPLSVSCVYCYLYLWIVHSWLPIWFSNVLLHIINYLHEKINGSMMEV